MHFKTSLFVFSILVFACGSANKVTDTQNNGFNDSIILGEGGGFTGAVVAWSIKSNGDIDSLNVWFKPVAKIGNMGAKKAREMITEASKILPTVPFEKPDNMYQFIRVNYGDSKGAATFTERDTAYFALYQKLRNAVIGVSAK